MPARTLISTVIAALMVTALGLTVAVPLCAQTLSASESREFTAALKEVERGNKERLDVYARRLTDPLARKIVSWYVLFQGGFGTEFEAIAAFTKQNPDWPRNIRLLARAEEAMSADLDPAFVIKWFGSREPITMLGKEKLGLALIRAGQKKKGISLIRGVWVDGDMTKDHEATFYRKYRDYLPLDDHRARADRLMWDGQYWPARRMIYKVDKPFAKLIEARTSLRHMRGNVDALVAAVPASLQNDPGLIFERLRWRRKKDMESAAELLKGLPASVPKADIWWDERAIQARRMLQKGFISEAYNIAANNGLTPGNAAEHAEAEWFAGWLALQFLGDSKVAVRHFKAMYDAVNFPVSRSRGAYWLGRATEASGDKAAAATWYKTAAAFPTTYYGQLAAGRVTPGEVLRLPPDASVADDIKARFDAHELVRAVRMLSAAGESERLYSFIMRIADLDSSPDWQVLTARLARLSGRRDLAIRVAKNSLQDHGHYIAGGYPTLVPPSLPEKASGKKPETSLVLAIVRQESEYDDQAVSYAGARGLMQLMPATARSVAKEVGLGFAPHKLTSDPDYNVMLGQSYLASLIQDFNGYLPLAIAAYNAGPYRVRQWIKLNGDPRDRDVDPIDWIELIPFSETRNYVQRVLENVQVYRRRLADNEVALRLEEDLR